MCGAIFGYGKSHIYNTFYETLNTLYTSFVPTQLSSSWNRQKVQQNTPDFSKKLLDITNNQIVIVTDGFGIPTEKSGDFAIQKLTYSMKRYFKWPMDKCYGTIWI